MPKLGPALRRPSANRIRAAVLTKAPDLQRDGSIAYRGTTTHIRPMRIFTIGYEGSTQKEVVAALSAAGVELLADVRAVPLSRRPGFSKNVLAAGLCEAGIKYIGLKSLGTPPEGREAARKHDHARLAEIYAGQLELPAALAQMAQLRALAVERPTALLCFEREPASCHRSLLVAAALPEAEVINLFAESEARKL